MRVVLDTNVFVSAVFFEGTPGRVLSLWRDRAFDIAVSREVLEEYVRVGERLTAQAPGVDPGPALDLIAAHAIFVIARSFPEPVCRDPDDDKFPACALAAEAKTIVSGDRDLLVLSPYRGVTVLSPSAFAKELSRTGRS